MSAISRYQPLIIFDIDQLSDQSSKSEIKKGILVFDSLNFLVKSVSTIVVSNVWIYLTVHTDIFTVQDFGI